MLSNDNGDASRGGYGSHADPGVAPEPAPLAFQSFLHLTAPTFQEAISKANARFGDVPLGPNQTTLPKGTVTKAKLHAAIALRELLGTSGSEIPRTPSFHSGDGVVLEWVSNAVDFVLDHLGACARLKAGAARETLVNKWRKWLKQPTLPTAALTDLLTILGMLSVVSVNYGAVEADHWSRVLAPDKPRPLGAGLRLSMGPTIAAAVASAVLYNSFRAVAGGKRVLKEKLERVGRSVLAAHAHLSRMQLPEGEGSISLWNQAALLVVLWRRGCRTKAEVLTGLRDFTGVTRLMAYAGNVLCLCTSCGLPWGFTKVQQCKCEDCSQPTPTSASEGDPTLKLHSEDERPKLPKLQGLIDKLHRKQRLFVARYGTASLPEVLADARVGPGGGQGATVAAGTPPASPTSSGSNAGFGSSSSGDRSDLPARATPPPSSSRRDAAAPHSGMGEALTRYSPNYLVFAPGMSLSDSDDSLVGSVHTLGSSLGEPSLPAVVPIGLPLSPAGLGVKVSPASQLPPLITATSPLQDYGMVLSPALHEPSGTELTPLSRNLRPLDLLDGTAVPMFGGPASASLRDSDGYLSSSPSLSDIAGSWEGGVSPSPSITGSWAGSVPLSPSLSDIAGSWAGGVSAAPAPVGCRALPHHPRADLLTPAPMNAQPARGLVPAHTGRPSRPPVIAASLRPVIEVHIDTPLSSQHAAQPLVLRASRPSNRSTSSGLPADSPRPTKRLRASSSSFPITPPGALRPRGGSTGSSYTLNDASVTQNHPDSGATESHHR